MAVNKHKTTFVIDVDSKKLNQKLDQTGKRVEDVGSKGFSAFKLKMVAGITAATVALSAFFNKITDWVNSASDLAESTSKFNVVFGDVAKQAKIVQKELTTAYGLSRTESTKLLAATGDLLTGFGFQGQEALLLSDKVQRLAVDLASFTNAEGGAEQVSNALTKALLGETESLKTFGIAIRQADVQTALAAKGMDKFTGIALRQAKAQVTMEMAIEQSKNAVGDYARTFDAYANVQRRVDSGLDDLSANLGGKFLPAATEAVRATEGLVNSLNDILEVNPSEILEEERIVLNALVGELTDVNTNQERRNLLIEELQIEYPDFLKNLDTETVTNKELWGELEKVNKTMIQRIQLTAITEEKDNAINRATRAQIALNRARREIEKDYITAMENRGLAVDKAATIEEKINATSTVGQVTMQRYAAGYVAANKSVLDYQSSLADVDEFNKEAIDLLKELTDLQSEYGMELDDGSKKLAKARKDDAEGTDEQTKAVVTLNLALADQLTNIAQLIDEEEDLKESDDEYTKQMLENIRARQKLEAKAAKETLRLLERQGMAYEFFARQVGMALVSGFEHEGLKGALKDVLITIISFLQREVLAAQVGAGVKAVFGDFSGLAQIVALQALFETFKSAVSSFAIGTDNFKGGIARVHQDETLFLPQGTAVANKRETMQIEGNTNQLLIELVREQKRSNEIAISKKIKIKRGLIYESYQEGKRDILGSR